MKETIKEKFLETLCKYNLGGDLVFEQLLLENGFNKEFVDKAMKAKKEIGIVGLHNEFVESL